MKAPVAGTSLDYDVRGSGPPVLFLHAFPLDKSMWEAQVRAVQATHMAVRFDARGFGGTPPGDGLLTMERIADDAAALLDHLSLSRAVLVGLSMGGYAAFAFVRRHRDRLRALVLADTRTAPDSVEQRQSRAAQAERVRREGPAGIADGFLQKAVGQSTQKERPEVVARVREMILKAPARGVTDALAGLAARADSAATLREIQAPTLVICGAEDALTPVADAEAIQRGVKGSVLEVIPKAGHLSALEDPGAFNRVLTGFLRTAPAPA
jgi:pimeloyl-ACP methyl ester carboxylesterase